MTPEGESLTGKPQTLVSYSVTVSQDWLAIQLAESRPQKAVNMEGESFLPEFQPTIVSLLTLHTKNNVTPAQKVLENLSLLRPGQANLACYGLGTVCMCVFVCVSVCCR